MHLVPCSYSIGAIKAQIEKELGVFVHSIATGDSAVSACKLIQQAVHAHLHWDGRPVITWYRQRMQSVFMCCHWLCCEAKEECIIGGLHISAICTQPSVHQPCTRQQQHVHLWHACTSLRLQVSDVWSSYFGNVNDQIAKVR